MKKFDFYSKKILLIIVLLLATSFTLSAQQTTTGVAIMKAVDEIGNVSPGVKLTLRGTLAYAINHMSGYKAFTRVNFSSISEEQKFQQSGYVDDNQIKEIGKATGAKYILVAEVANYDASHITITASIIDIESTELRNTADPEIAPIDPEGMKESCIKIARSLLDINGSIVSDPDNDVSSHDSDVEALAEEEVVGVDTTVVAYDPTSGSATGNNEREFHRILNERIRQNGTLVYAQSPYEIKECNGIYVHDENGNEAEFFQAGLDDLTREHFCIIFTFRAIDNKGTWWAGAEQYPLMLSRGWRILGILLKEDGYIYITTNNQDHEYSTGLTYTPGEDKAIELEYDNGVININGVRLDVEMDEYGGDNTLTSINYSSGNAFKGNICAVRVYNMR